jgi:NADH:ubiquinone oxidoreductase subunit K
MTLVTKLDLLIIYGCILFSIGLFGVLVARNFIIILISFELMFLAVCCLFCLFAHMLDHSGGLVFTLYILGVAAAESALGLAIYIMLYMQLKQI